MTVILIAASVVLLIIIGVILIYNVLVRARNKVTEGWSGIDVQLTRRHDLIPNLVETVKGYAKHERSIFEEVTKARTQATDAQTDGPAHAGDAESTLNTAVSKLLAVAENYPDLKASNNYLTLQTELANTEDQLAAARRIYNSNVQFYNTRLQMFPNNLIVRTIGDFEPAEFFELEDPTVREAPNVSF